MAKDKMNKSPREKLVIPVAAATILGWLTALATGVITQNYIPFEISTPIMVLLGGYVFGVQIVRSNTSGD